MPPSTTEASASLRISIVHPDASERQAWAGALRQRLSAARIDIWTASGPLAHATPATLHFGVGWKPPREYFQAHPDLAAFFAAGAGVDHLLALEGLPPHLPIIRLEDAGMAQQMFSYCLHQILRRLHRVDDYEAQQRERVWREHPARAPQSLPVGVVGLGALGAELAQRLSALGFPLRGFARSPHALPGVHCFHGPAQWQPFLAGCEVLVLMAPLTAETRGLIDAKALAALPQGAWLINVARGALVDQDALLRSLDAGHLAGATLDVFETEPLPTGHAFWQHPRIRLTPHISAQTLIEPSADQIADKILRLQQGQSVSGTVDRLRGY